MIRINDSSTNCHGKNEIIKMMGVISIHKDNVHVLFINIYLNQFSNEYVTSFRF